MIFDKPPKPKSLGEHARWCYECEQWKRPCHFSDGQYQKIRLCKECAKRTGYNWFLEHTKEIKQRQRDKRYNNPRWRILEDLKRRCKRSHMPLNMEQYEIDPPEQCPLSREVIDYSENAVKGAKPFAVRIHAAAGYAPGNVCVVRADVGKLLGDRALFDYKDQIDKFVANWQELKDNEIKQARGQ